MFLQLVLLPPLGHKEAIGTLVYRIDVYARLLILRKKIPPIWSYFGLHVY